MPNLDALASQNVVFANAYSNSNWTKPAIASLFTGLYVSQHGVKYVVTGQEGDLPVTQRLPDDAVTLAEIMRERGYYTLGVVENVHVSEKLGFAQGFDCWDEEPYGATNVTNQVLYHLDGTRDKRGDKPLFTYVHYFDPHTPYYRTRSFETEGMIAPGLGESKSNDLSWTNYTFGVDRGIIGMSFLERRRLEDLYDGEVRHVDNNLARLLAGLKERRLYDDTWLIVTADHGENFGEKHRLTHPHDCFTDTQVKVPLVMRLPRSIGPREMTVTDRVEHVDLTMTLLSFAGATPLAGMGGRDIMPAILDNQPLRARNVLCESEGGEMLLASKFKYVSVPTELRTFRFLYDVASDPLEETNIADADPKKAATLADSMTEMIKNARLAKTVQASDGVKLTSEEVEKLKALGYLH
jgi:arylsulfatase A-like enzyme